MLNFAGKVCTVTPLIIGVILSIIFQNWYPIIGAAGFYLLIALLFACIYQSVKTMPK